MARLRDPGGCPWDQEQTHASLARCLIDETSELLETIDRADMPHMREELGDVLIQIVFHARLAEEAGLFNFEDVAHDISEKLIRRHPHVFGSDDGGIDSPDKVITQWDQIKLQEKAAKAATTRYGVAWIVLCRRRFPGTRKPVPALSGRYAVIWIFPSRLKNETL